METSACFNNDLVDNKSGLPNPHLSFIINLLLPKRLVGKQRTKRQFEAFEAVRERDKHLSGGYFRPILVGSVAEGYNIPDAISKTNPYKSVFKANADGDIIFENTVLVVLANAENVKSLPDASKKCLLDCEGSHPCYGRVRLYNEPRKTDDVFIFVPETKSYYLSGTKIQAKLFSGMVSVGEDMELHGPALSTFESAKSESEIINEFMSNTQSQIHSQDYVYAIPVVGWPDIAKPWIDRQEKGNWIDTQMLQDIVQTGIHVVPVPHRLSLHPELEWRLSFATIEVYLAQHVITDEQRQCYVFLKIMHSEVIKKLNILSSYHMKTVFLYACEKLPSQSWVESVSACLLFILDLLIECCQKRNLPNFFIPENNMIDYLTETQTEQVIEVLQLVRKNPLQPVFQFTDSFVIGLHSLTSPFRANVKEVTDDAVKFPIHMNIQKSTEEGFIPALFKEVFLLAIEQKPEEAVLSVIDVFPVINKYCPGSCSVAKILDTIATTSIQDIELTINIYEEAQKYAEQYPDVLLLRGNLACMFHALAYTKPADSDERMIAFAKSESLFNSVVQDISSTSLVDFCCLLINQGRFEEAYENLSKYIEADTQNASGNRQFFSKIEAVLLDEYLQKEITCHGMFSINSVSMAYYLLVKCILSMDNEMLYDKVLREFTEHCGKVNQSSSHSLLGYALMLVDDYDGARGAFKRALENCNGPSKLTEENLDFCENLCKLKAL